jgi:pimeloyl-ACP methyl ester carboxylesterase
MKIPAPGRMVELGRRSLHLLEQGTGSPTVVLEAGIAASSISWCLVQKLVAEFTTVVSYDRAGFGWSDFSAENNSGFVLQTVQDLGLLLASAGLSGPFVLVGHSFGGLIVRLFQQLHPDRVAGMVLVDPVVRTEWRNPDQPTRRKLARGVMLSRRGAWLARIGVVGFVLRMLTEGRLGVPKLVARVTAGNGAGVANRLVGEVRKMPPENWPAIAAQWSEARSFKTMANNLEKLPISVTQLDETRGLGDLPIVVLSASKHIPEHAHDAALSTRGEHIVVPESGHWMQLDAPDIVAQAIRQVVAKVRAQ